MATSPISKERIAELLAKTRAARNSSNIPASASTLNELQGTAQAIADALKPQSSQSDPATGIHGESITYNKEQNAFIQVATSGQSSILIGAAGTGKTTCMRGTILSLIQSGKAGLLAGEGHKYLPASGTPGIVAVSFTRRAVANLRRAMPAGMQDNCITIHKLLEYQPVYYAIQDPVTGEEKNTMKFEATRHHMRPLSNTIRTVIIDESSMVSVELFKELVDALPHEVQFIFLGDIQQLPPVFGSAILGYKMLELPTIELTQVYRQALESPIIRLAHRILSGTPILSTEFGTWEVPNQLKLHPWKKKLSADVALLTAAKFFTTAIEHGALDVERDVILIPFNKSFGTDELNKHIANHLAHNPNNQVPVYEVQAGFNKLYFHVGAKVLYDKEDAVIESISYNTTYTGRRPQKESIHLDYWGHNHLGAVSKAAQAEVEMTEEAMDFLLEAAAGVGSEDERVRLASHTILIRMIDSGQEIELESAADINSMLLAYALTVHKSQGSEWRKVFLVLHQSHATMVQRELLYTGVTRAREELYVICEPDSFVKGILGQRIKGNTLAEKAEYFKGKLENNGGTY